MNYQELKRQYQEIGKTYSFDVLSGYINLFSTVLKGVKNKRNLNYRINLLRLKVYKRLVKEFKRE